MIPRWASYFIFKFLPKWIFIQGPTKKKNNPKSCPIIHTRSESIIEDDLNQRESSLREESSSSNFIKKSEKSQNVIHPLLLNCLSGSIAHDVRVACAEITGIANFLSSRKENQKNISEWHILAAVLG